jgi:hypothetical protein
VIDEPAVAKVKKIKKQKKVAPLEAGPATQAFGHIKGARGSSHPLGHPSS